MAAFLIMSYAVTGATALVPALTSRDLLPYGQALYDLLAHFLGSAVPAFLVVAALRSAPGVRELAQRSGRWRVGVDWYLVALLGPTILTLLLAAALSGSAPLATAADNWPQFFSLILPSLAFAFIFSNWFEEIGWTGFMLDGVQDPFALGHLPGFIVEGGSVVDGLVILGVLFFPQFASRIIVAWLYNNSHRSILLVGLFHSAYNRPPRASFQRHSSR